MINSVLDIIVSLRRYYHDISLYLYTLNTNNLILYISIVGISFLLWSEKDLLFSSNQENCKELTSV